MGIKGRVWAVQIIAADEYRWDPIVFDERPTDNHIWGYILENYPNPEEEQYYLMDGDKRGVYWEVTPVNLRTLPEPSDSVPDRA